MNPANVAMGFKVDTSFLKYLTMGALGARKVCDELTSIGFEPIELERYSNSNKIWSTKVKRLRIADLICVKTGLRVEVRAKSKLAIRMSDAPNNRDRAWDAGLRNADIVALIACSDSSTGPIPANSAVYFSVESLRKSVDSSSLGAPKSASEGAERDRNWPAIVPSSDGEVLSTNREKLVVQLNSANGATRRQTYTLNGKNSYFRKGDTFSGNISIIAGTPHRLANVNSFLSKKYDPISDLNSKNPVDRYAAAKSIRFRTDIHAIALPYLEGLISQEAEERVALEAAGSAASLGSSKGQDFLASMLWNEKSTDLSMESILIMTEIGGPFARSCLINAAKSQALTGDERRQAAIWGLGRGGLKVYSALLPFLSDNEDNVVFHAIAGFGRDTSKSVISGLIKILISGDRRAAPSASEALRAIGSPDVLHLLVKAENSSTVGRDWIVATIGNLDPDMVKSYLNGSTLFDQIRPMLLTSPGGSWVSTDETRSNLAFLSKQFTSL